MHKCLTIDNVPAHRRADVLHAAETKGIGYAATLAYTIAQHEETATAPYYWDAANWVHCSYLTKAPILPGQEGAHCRAAIDAIAMLHPELITSVRDAMEEE